jgi:Arc/MetJ-type ribon-helix-helix transcriptional regulator
MPETTAEPVVDFTVRLPKPLHRWLRRWCFDNDISMAEFVRSAVEDKRADIERAATAQR